ncbi:MAG: hypothetical protein ACXVCX_21325, partial [Ktedonobacterales bacterium]
GLGISQMRSTIEFARQHGLQRVHLIELEYALAMREAELAWTRKLADEITSGTLEGVAEWAAWQRAADQQSEEPREHEAHDEEEG